MLAVVLPNNLLPLSYTLTMPSASAAPLRVTVWLSRHGAIRDYWRGRRRGVDLWAGLGQAGQR